MRSFLTRRTVILILASLGPLAGQQTVAPTAATVGPPRGTEIGNYNVMDSFETGYRFRSVGGDLDKYRSDVNFGNGIRLLGSRLTVNSKDGHGVLFDEIVLTTQGLGNDPYQFSSLRVQRNGLYRYDFLWRLNDYFNPALPVAGGLHRMDTERRTQDHDLTLLPQSPVRLLLGYTRNSQDGAALTTVQSFNSGDVSPVFADIRRVRNEYRLGGEADLLGVKLHVVRGWDDFKEDTPYSLAPATSTTPATLTGFRREEPYHGTTPWWRLHLRAEKTYWAAAGHFTYATGRRNFLIDETAAGTDRFGSERNRQVLVSGDGRRPVTSGNVTLSLFPTDGLTISNHTAFHNTRMEGDSVYSELNNATASGPYLFFNFLGIRSITNTTDATLRVSKWLGLYGGYHYATRRIRSVEQVEIDGVPQRLPASQENRLDSGLAGIRLNFARSLTVSLDAEIGRADRPFFPVSERDYHGFNARVRYKSRSFSLSASARTSYNTNSVSLSSHSSRGRNYSVDGSWTPREWLSVDGGYSKLHLNTASGIAYFVDFEMIQGEQSIYVSNIHAANLGVRLGLGKRADLYAGYSHVEDTGDGRINPFLGSGARPDPFVPVQTFPLAFRSPLARLSIRLHGNLRWNAGYQHYNYREDFFGRQSYRAHTGYTSVLWSF